MTRIQRSALVQHSAQQMYALVDDIESYPRFMHGCIDAEVVSRDDNEVVGRLTLGKAGMRHTFTTRNELEPGRRMSMTLVEGPFRHFRASWEFIELAPDACKVTLDMEFEFSGGLLGMALEKLFNRSANTLVDDVVHRADTLYGEGHLSPSHARER